MGSICFGYLKCLIHIRWLTFDMYLWCLEKDHSLNTVRQFYNEKLNSENELYKVSFSNGAEVYVLTKLSDP